MRAAHAITLGFAVTALLSACDREPAPPDPSEIPKPDFSARILDAAAAPHPSSSAGAAAAASALGALRSATLDIPPSELPSQRLAFLRGDLVRLEADAVVIEAADRSREVARHPLVGARRTVSLADGGLLATGTARTLYVAPRTSSAVELSRMVVLPGTALAADWRDRRRIWLVSRGARSLVPYVLDGERHAPKSLTIDEPTDLRDFDGAALCVLADGSVLHTTSDGLAHVHLEGRRTALPEAELRAPWRLLPSRRVDAAWWLAPDGRWALLQIAPALRRLAQGSFGGAPFEAISAGDLLAVVRAERSVAGAPRRWRLQVIDATGKLRLEAELGADAVDVQRDDWATRLAEARGVALSADPPLVAVGGPGGAEVWNHKAKRRLTR